METRHRVHVANARDLGALDDDSVELVVTSPPYPMVEMWDDVFAAQSPAVGGRLADGDGDGAFEAMHGVLDDVWAEVPRVLIDGGVVCVNVGDATRTIDDRFRVYRNGDRIGDALEALGLDPLPSIVWRKPANSAAKFMGSGMLPPNAYVTQEHEHVLVFRNGGPRTFEPKADRRYEAALFWEERNRWFSDLWTDVRGRDQELADEELRERSAAFPFAVPYRLISMYSVYGDTVLDPFLGTGTTSLAAAVAGRNSMGYERTERLAEEFFMAAETLPSLSRDTVADRLRAHRSHVADVDAGDLAYEAEHYDFPVRSKQERGVRFYAVDAVERTGQTLSATHRPVTAVEDHE